jgi:RHS repeat-associated protein
MRNNLLSATVLIATAPAALAQLPSPPNSPAPVTRLEYYAEGNFKKRVEGYGTLNYATTHEYDSLNRRFKTTDAKNKPTLFTYNGREDLTQVRDPRQLDTFYPRNGLGDQTGLTSPDTGPAAHTVDAAGNLKTRIDARGVLATYHYDALNRLTLIEYGASGSPEQTIVWNYDQTGPAFSNGRGRLTSTQYVWGTSTYAYDPQGRLLSTTQTSSETSVSHTVSYGYDAAGRITSITYPSGRKLHIPHSGGLPTALSVAPDASSPAVALLGGLQFEPVPGGQGPARAWIWNLDSGTLAHERVFDVYGRLIRHPLGGAVRDISYDAADRISSFVHYNAVSGTAVSALDQGFGYDELGRLTTVNTSVGNWTYVYDDNGNRTQLTLLAGGNTTTRTHSIHSQSNRLLSVSNPTRSFGHDQAGNTASDQQGSSAMYATYDPSGRLVEMRTSANGLNFKVTRYAHNAEGQRVFKEMFAQQNCNANGMCVTLPIYPPISTVFVYDQEGRLLGEYSAFDGSVRREYVWLQGMPVAIIDGTPANPVIAYVHTDHLDTPRTVIDRQGRQRWTWVAEPFGNSAPATNPLGFGEYVLNLRMPGQYHDAETGLSDNWHRTYDSSLGRYTQSDPIGLAGGINTYAYVGGNPLSYVDPRGLNCTAVGNRVTCNVPGGPVVVFPRPSGWPDYIGPGEWGYHSYNELAYFAGVDRACLENYIRNHPTPGAPNGPATPSGTPNDASPPPIDRLQSSMVRSYAMTVGGSQVVVNVTMPGHPLFPGYVARTVSQGRINNIGEGTGWMQGRYSPFREAINGAWQDQNDAAIAACRCRR